MKLQDMPTITVEQIARFKEAAHFRIAQLEAENKALKADKWISVDTELPDAGEIVLASFGESAASCCIATIDDKGQWFSRDYRNRYGVSRWQALPEFS